MAIAHLLCGPSLAGKSAVADQIARVTGAIILSADAVNSERGLPFGAQGLPRSRCGQRLCASCSTACTRTPGQATRSLSTTRSAIAGSGIAIGPSALPAASSRRCCSCLRRSTCSMRATRTPRRAGAARFFRSNAWRTTLRGSSGQAKMSTPPTCRPRRHSMHISASPREARPRLTPDR